MASNRPTLLPSVLGAALLVLLSGCARKEITPLEDVLVEQEASASRTQAYLLRVGDVIDVYFAADPGLDFDTPITPSGTISLPMAGEIPAAGRTTGELGTAVAEAMAPYLVDPTSSVVIQSLAKQYVYVIGEVTSPGRIEDIADLTVSMALAEAGGIHQLGKPSSVMVVRTRGVERPVAFKVDVTKILSARDMSQDVALRPNDVVYVPKSVIGQVDEFVDLFMNRIAPAQLFYLRGYDIAHLRDAAWRF